MANDLFVMTQLNKYNDVVNFVQGKVEERVACRHDYPIWPVHGYAPGDDFEQDFHGRIRSEYYDSTKYLIQVLRRLRTIAQA